MRTLIIAFAVFLVGCGCNYTPVPVVTQVGTQYEYMQDPMGGQPMVRVYDGGMSYMVAYDIFNSLGYAGCVNYYHTHRGCYPTYNVSVYHSWRNTGRVVPSYRPTGGGMRQVVPAYRPAFTPPARNTPAYRPSSSPAYRPSYTPSRSTPSYRPSTSSSSRPSYRRS